MRKKTPVVVRAHTADKAGTGAQLRHGQRRVGRRTARGLFRCVSRHCVAHGAKAFVVYQLHRALGQGKISQYAVIFHPRQHVNQRISHTNYPLHPIFSHYFLQRYC